MYNLMVSNRKKEIKHSAEFHAIFGVKLHTYMDYRTGFDSIRFDEEFIKSGDGCMEDTIRLKYGEPGVLLIYKLIKYEEKS